MVGVDVPLPRPWSKLWPLVPGPGSGIFWPRQAGPSILMSQTGRRCRSPKDCSPDGWSHAYVVPAEAQTNRNLLVDMKCSRTPHFRSNDSTSPAMDQSGLEPSSLVQVQSKKFLDRDRTNPQFFETWTELAWTALDQSTQAESARIRRELLIH